MSHTVGKKDLIARIAALMDVTQVAAERFLEAHKEAVEEELKSGNAVRLHGIGTLKLHGRKPRTARNPKTGETFQVPARVALKFVPTKPLAEAVDIQ